MKDKKEIDKAVGDRLSELLNVKSMSQADLRRKAARLSGIEIPSSHMSLMINGKRSLPHKYAEIFSTVLEAPLGFLLGDDGFQYASFAEYVEQEKNHSDFQNELMDMSKYDYLINPLGYYVTGGAYKDLVPISYSVRHRKTIAQIPAEEMDAFLEDVNEYITMLLKPLMKKYAGRENR